ncbi:hypothetical protein Tco_0042813 [Tanacetum coccineum]
MLDAMTIHFEIWPVGLRKLNSAVRKYFSDVELSDDHSWSKGQSLHASRPNRLCARARSVDDMPFRIRACKDYTRWVFCKLYGRPIVRHLICPTKRHGFRLRPFKNSFQATIGYLNFPTCLWVKRGGETVSNSVFRHDLCKLVIAKMGSAITYDSTRGTESGDERFKKFANHSGVIGGERFRFNPFRQVIDCHEYILVPS